MAGVPAAASFAALTPDAVMDRAERVSGRRASGVCRPLTSYINRVYEIGLEDGGFLVAKFYRPGRWTRAALQDEQDFLLELAADGAPVEEIATRAHLAPGTVRNYLSSAAAKLGAANRHEAAHAARRHGWI